MQCRIDMGKGYMFQVVVFNLNKTSDCFFQIYAKLFHGQIVLIEPKTFNCTVGRCRSLSPVYYKNLSLHPVIPNIVPVFSS